MFPAVILGVPCYGRVEPECMFSLIDLLMTNRELICGIQRTNFMYIDEARNWIVRDTLKKQTATHLLFLDSDMFWTPDTLKRLLARDRAVVGAQYFRRQPPYETVAGNFGTDNKILPLPTLQPGLFGVECLGLGCTLIETKTLADMQRHFGDERWFRSEECGEDLWFFRRLQQMGVPAFIDGDLIAGHVGQFVITDDHWRAAHEGGKPIAFRQF